VVQALHGLTSSLRREGNIDFVGAREGHLIVSQQIVTQLTLADFRYSEHRQQARVEHVSVGSVVLSMASLAKISHRGVKCWFWIHVVLPMSSIGSLLMVL
jgi:hypothetical protein